MSKPARLFTEEARQEMAERYEAGEAIEDLAAAYKVSTRQIYRECSRMGVSRPRVAPVVLYSGKHLASDWPRPTMDEQHMLDLINQDGGFPVRVVIDGQTFDVRRAA